MVETLGGIEFESNGMGSSRSSRRIGEEGDWELEEGNAGGREETRSRIFGGFNNLFFLTKDFVSGTASRGVTEIPS
jgi:hypothetical protein